MGSDDPCLDNGDYCDGLEYCEEGSGIYICSSTGDPCGTLSCDEIDDTCTDSDVTLIIADAYGYSGTIYLELENDDEVSEVYVEVCDADKRAWLNINTEICYTTTRSHDFSCWIYEPDGEGCVAVELKADGWIEPGIGSIVKLSYTIDPTATSGDFADLYLTNIDVQGSTMLVTPKPGVVGLCESDENCDDGLFCNGKETCWKGGCQEETNPCPPPGEPEKTECDEVKDICYESTTTSTSSSTTTTTPPITTTSTTIQPITCKVTVTPDGETITFNQTLQFSAITECNGDDMTPDSYTWYVSGSAVGTIDSNGLYTAGETEGTDTVEAMDEVNGVGGTATVVVESGKVIAVSPSEVKRSRWIPLFWLMYIKGTGTNFAIFETPVVYDSKSVLKLPALVFSPTDIYQIILIMPSILTGIGFDGSSEAVTVTVDGLTDTFEIMMLPAPFDEEKNLK